MQHKLTMAFWISLAVSAAIYLIMVGWSLPRISAAAGGLAPFDMRPSGYEPDEARTFLSALSEEGRGFYLSVQHRLDLVYPPVLALTLALGLWIMAPVRAVIPLLVLVAVPLLAMIADLAENWLVAQMLNTPPESLNDNLVAIASTATVLKSVMTTIAMTLLLLFTAYSGWRKWRRR